jgi:hypothetical protein
MDNFLKLVDVVQRATEFVDKSWSYHSTVTLAVLALVFGSEKIRLSPSIRGIVAAGYGIFAIGNCFSLSRAQEAAIRWITLLNAEIAKAPQSLPIAPLDPFPVWQIVLFQLSISSAVIIAVLLSGRIRPVELSVKESITQEQAVQDAG